MGVDSVARGVIDRIALRRRDGAAQADREFRAAAGCSKEIRVAAAGQGIGPGDGLPVLAQRPAGVLVCVKDGDPADAVPVRISRQRVGQRDGTSVAQIGQTALVVGVLVDDEGEIDVGQIVQIRVPALLLRRDHDFRAVLAEGVQAVGIHELLDTPVLIQRPEDGRRSRIAAGDRRGHGQPVVVGDHIVQKAERERQHQRRRLEAYPRSNSRPPYACAPPARRSAPMSRSSGGRGRASRR